LGRYQNIKVSSTGSLDYCGLKQGKHSLTTSAQNY